jgi:hypothetical protein
MVKKTGKNWAVVRDGMTIAIKPTKASAEAFELSFAPRRSVEERRIARLKRKAEAAREPSAKPSADTIAVDSKDVATRDLVAWKLMNLGIRWGADWRIKSWRKTEIALERWGRVTYIVPHHKSAPPRLKEWKRLLSWRLPYEVKISAVGPRDVRGKLAGLSVSRYVENLTFSFPAQTKRQEFITGEYSLSASVKVPKISREQLAEYFKSRPEEL